MLPILLRYIEKNGIFVNYNIETFFQITCCKLLIYNKISLN